MADDPGLYRPRWKRWMAEVATRYRSDPKILVYEPLAMFHRGYRLPRWMANTLCAARFEEHDPEVVDVPHRNVLEALTQYSKSDFAHPLRGFLGKGPTTSLKRTVRGIHTTAAGISQPLITLDHRCCATVAFLPSHINRVSKSDDSNLLYHVAPPVPQYVYFGGRRKIHWV
jgi:hypothetical protein